jgi:threonine dehydrogenase-like Zn-dependent dehydrogenase
VAGFWPTLDRFCKASLGQPEAGAATAEAGRLGADATVRPSSVDAVASIREIVPGGVDVVLECAGVAETFAQAPMATGEAGQLSFWGHAER